MRVQSLGSSLVFAAGVSVSLLFMLHVFAPLVGSRNVVLLHLAGSLVAYLPSIATSPRIAFRNALVAVVGAASVVGLVLSTSSGISEAAVGFTFVLGLVRSGLDAGARRPRTLAAEALLAGTSLAFAAALSSPGWLGEAMALWGFALVQSLYFMLPLSVTSNRDVEKGDPFERAYARLLAMLEEV